MLLRSARAPCLHGRLSSNVSQHMVTVQQAQELALAHARQAWAALPVEDEWTVVQESTIERAWGWVFTLSSKLWLESQDLRYAVAGNAPLFVVRNSGQVLETGTALRVEHYIARYETTGSVHG